MRFAFLLLLSLCSPLRRHWANRCAQLSGYHLLRKGSCCCSAPRLPHCFSPRVPACPVSPAGPCLPWHSLPRKLQLCSGPWTLKRVSLGAHNMPLLLFDSAGSPCVSLGLLFFLLSCIHTHQHCNAVSKCLLLQGGNTKCPCLLLLSAFQVSPKQVSCLLHASMRISDGRRGGDGQSKRCNWSSKLSSGCC